MGVFSPFTIIRGMSLAHLTSAYFMLVSPRTLAEQNIVVILGSSMKIPQSVAFTKPTEATALVALVLAFLAISDLLAASLPTRSALEYWTTVTPARLLVLFVLTAYIYMTSSESSLADSAFRSLKGGQWPGDTIKNDLCFAVGFIESMTWFWIYSLLRDERNDFLLEEAQKANEREEREREMAMFSNPYGRDRHNSSDLLSWLNGERVLEGAENSLPTDAVPEPVPNPKKLRSLLKTSLREAKVQVAQDEQTEAIRKLSIGSVTGHEDNVLDRQSISENHPSDAALQSGSSKRLRFLTKRPTGERLRDLFFTHKVRSAKLPASVRDDLISDRNESTSSVTGSLMMSGALIDPKRSAADFLFSGPRLEDLSLSTPSRSFSAYSMLGFARTPSSRGSGTPNLLFGYRSPTRSSTSAVHQMSSHGSIMSLPLSMTKISRPASLPDLAETALASNNYNLISQSTPALLTSYACADRSKSWPAPILPDTLMGSLLLYLDQGGCRTPRMNYLSRCASANVLAETVCTSGFQTLPPELVQTIMTSLSPADFVNVRLSCQTWFHASLDFDLLALQLRRGGWWQAGEKDLAAMDVDDGAYNAEHLLALRLEKENAMTARPGSLCGHAFEMISEVDFAELHTARKKKDTARLFFTVSKCGRFVLASRDRLIFVFALLGGGLRPICSIACPQRVLAISMDTRFGQNVVAALLEGRCAILADVRDDDIDWRDNNRNASALMQQRSHHELLPLANRSVNSLTSQGTVLKRPRRWQKTKVVRPAASEVENPEIELLDMPLVTVPKSLIAKIGPDFDSSRSIAICPTHRCVAFGCKTGIQLRWVDAVSEQETDRWFPHPTPTDLLFFHHPREGDDSNKKFRICSSTNDTAEPRHIFRRFARRATSNLSGILSTSSISPPRHESTLNLTGDIVTTSSMASHAINHLRTSPLSDGVHVLFTDLATNLLCLGSDCPISGSAKFSRTIMLVPPRLPSSQTAKAAEDFPKLSPPPRPTTYSSAPCLSHGVRIVAAYGKDIIFYSIPSDVFAHSPAHPRASPTAPNDTTSALEQRREQATTLNTDWLYWTPKPSKVWSLPAVQADSFPMQIEGVHVGSMSHEVSEVAVLTNGGSSGDQQEDVFADVVVWSFSSLGQKGEAWRLKSGVHIADSIGDDEMGGKNIRMKVRANGGVEMSTA